MTSPEYPRLDCAAFDEMLAAVAERELLPAAGQAHLAECRACAAMLEDFEAIAARVRGLPFERDPGPEQWEQLREALVREGVIHAAGAPCPEAASPQPQLVPKR
ncbi:MAG: hypothetical protein ACRD1E_04255 [Terriglobales bacterium]